jgi:quercetin dioxygenase-like cupin family protein
MRPRPDAVRRPALVADVLSGEWAAEVEGRPTRTLRQGEGQYVENGRWHGGKVIGDAPLRLLGLMIVDKDQPITTMVK